MKKAAIYARVSSTNQRDNTSPERQLENGRAYCAANGYVIVAERIEVASGVLVFARPKFRELLELAERGDVDVIVCDIPDRLGRGDAIAQLELLAKFSGAPVEYASIKHDPESLEGIVTDAAQGMVSKIERYNTRRRTMGGRRKRAEQGFVIATAYRPLGYIYNVERDERGNITKSDLAINESEAKIVLLIYELCVHEFMSTHAIARYLSDKGIPPPRKGRKGTREGTWYWEPTTVKNILRNETYAGVWRYGKTKFKYDDLPNGKRVRRIVTHLSEDNVKVPVRAIISHELWEQAQYQLQENRKKFRKPTKYSYLLRGRVRCAKCGSAMHGHTEDRHATVQTYYRCNRAFKQYMHSRCDVKVVTATALETTVKAIIREAMTDEGRLFAGVNTLREQATKDRKALEVLFVGCKTRIEKETSKVDRYQDLYASGDMTLDQYRAKKGTVEAEIQKLNQERNELNVRLGKCQILDPLREEELRQTREEIERRMDWGSEEQWVKLLEMLRVEVVYDARNEEVTVSGMIEGKRTLSSISRSTRRRRLRHRPRSNRSPGAAGLH